MSDIEKKLFLKKDKERFILQNRHPWIFSGAIEKFPKGFSSGDVVSVCSHEGQFLAIAYFHAENSLAGRILSFEKKSVEQIIRERIRAAWLFRQKMFSVTNTNAYRLINAEEDGLPGLILDVYGQVGVLQINTLGMEKLRPIVIRICQEELLFITSLYEKSTSSARAQEDLLPAEGWIYGDPLEEVVVREEGVLFAVSITEGQKTGFFLDQREMRKKIGSLSSGKQVLNCFSYSGGFSLHALLGGAVHVTSVDTCYKAIELCKRNTLLNEVPLEKHSIVQEDVFAFLDKEDLSMYDVIILDPPAFAKKRQDIEPASRGYQQLLQKVLRKCKAGTLVLTCSCSYFIDTSLFQQVVFKAAATSDKRSIKILSHHIHALDHPISLYHPEGDYLKSLLLWVE